jgi:hypothetical protein
VQPLDRLNLLSMKLKSINSKLQYNTES